MYKLLHAITIHILVLLATLFPVLTFGQGTSTDRMGIIEVHKIESNKNKYFTIKLNYPNIRHVPHEKEINALIDKRLAYWVAEFKRNNAIDKPIEGMPLTENSNTLTINYKVFSASPKFLSLRFAFDVYHYGAAHPNTSFESLNYDLVKGKNLKLDDVLHGYYLKHLSIYSKKVLTEKLSQAANSQTAPYLDGLKPTPENFDIWNVTERGLLLTFPAYQVAAYVFGPQEVTVPSADLRQFINPQYSWLWGG